MRRLSLHRRLAAWWEWVWHAWIVACASVALGLTACDPDVGGPIVDCVPHPTPACGQPCENDCGSGCDSCLDVGRDYCAGGAVRRCRSYCIETIEVCPMPDACAGSICAKSVDDCDAVRAAYHDEITASQGRSIVAVVRTDSSSLPPGGNFLQQ